MPSNNRRKKKAAALHENQRQQEDDVHDATCINDNVQLIGTGSIQDDNQKQPDEQQPAEETQTTEETQQPAEETQTTEETQQPDEETQQPAEETQTTEETQQPAEETQTTEETQQPAEEQQITEETQQPAEETQQPAEETQQPAEETQQSDEETQQPAEETQTTEETQQPAEETQEPTGEQQQEDESKVNNSGNSPDVNNNNGKEMNTISHVAYHETSITPSAFPGTAYQYRQLEPLHLKIVVIGDNGVGKSSLINQFIQREFDPEMMATIGVEFKEYKHYPPLLTYPSPCLTDQSVPQCSKREGSSRSRSRSPSNRVSKKRSTSRSEESSHREQSKEKHTSSSHSSHQRPHRHTTNNPQNTPSGDTDVAVITLIVNKRCVTLQLWDIAGQQYCGTMTKQYYRGSSGAVVVADMTRPSSFDTALQWQEDFIVKTLGWCGSGGYVATERPMTRVEKESLEGWLASRTVVVGKTPSSSPLSGDGVLLPKVHALPVMLLANKLDLVNTLNNNNNNNNNNNKEKPREDIEKTPFITPEAVESFASTEHFTTSACVSAKDSAGVQEVFNSIIKLCCAHALAREEEEELQKRHSGNVSGKKANGVNDKKSVVRLKIKDGNDTDNINKNTNNKNTEVQKGKKKDCSC